MSKRVSSILFSVAFLLLITAPTIMMIVDNSSDSSFIFSVSEEEEKSSEEDLNIEIYFTSIHQNQPQLLSSTAEDNAIYFLREYSKPHLHIIYPPPEFKHRII